MEHIRLGFGLELECGIKNKDVLKKMGPYHGGRFFGAGGWVVEQDTSVSFGRDGFEGVEMVSPLFTLEDLEANLDLVMNRIGGNNGNLEGIRINNSCGAHIHFSTKLAETNKYNMLRMQLPMHTMKWIRETVKARISLEVPHAYESFKRQYYRDFARKQDSLSDMAMNKYSEFHFTQRMGTEWRSFNLMGVETWGEIKKMVRIGCETLETGINDHMEVCEDIEITQNDVLTYAKENNFLDSAKKWYAEQMQQVG